MYNSSDSSQKPFVVDLRSDTVTKPSSAMRKAMFEAEVGDDVYGEDPTVNKLQERAAEIFGREAALFVPTGSMGNQIALKVHTRPGQEIICEEKCHIYNYEMAMMSQFSGCIARTIAAPDGMLTWEAILRKLSPPTYYYAQTGLVELENTGNMAGGTVYPQAIADEICDKVHEIGLPIHLDGARVFNAAAALGKPVADVTRKYDSVMFCLSKGLGAPVGSMLVGSKKFIEMAHIYRKSMGGGMRQAGILAAAGLIAIEEGPKRLHEDHANAKFLAEGLAKTPGIKIDPAKVQTNILIFDISGTGLESSAFTKELAKRNVLAGGVNAELVRFVTHLDVDRAGCEFALGAVQEIANAAKPAASGR